MPKRISKRPSDVNQAAYLMVQRSIGEQEIEILPPPKANRSEISRIMAEMGRKGGRIGGRRSLETMSPSARKKRAKKAAEARWKNPLK